MQQLPFALLPPLDHLQDGDGSAQVPPQLQHLLVRPLVVLTVLRGTHKGGITVTTHVILYVIQQSSS